MPDIFGRLRLMIFLLSAEPGVAGPIFSEALAMKAMQPMLCSDQCVHQQDYMQTYHDDATLEMQTHWHVMHMQNISWCASGNMQTYARHICARYMQA